MQHQRTNLAACLLSGRQQLATNGNVWQVIVPHNLCGSQQSITVLRRVREEGRGFQIRFIRTMLGSLGEVCA
jgi:hypothetical protein